MIRWAVTAILLCGVSLGVNAQTSELELSSLRAKAQNEGSVEVRVVSRAAASVVSSDLSNVNPEQRKAIQRAQDRILVGLIARGLIVGNEIFLQSDGSFSMRVLPGGLEALVVSTDVQKLSSVAPRQGEVSK